MAEEITAPQPTGKPGSPPARQEVGGLFAPLSAATAFIGESAILAWSALVAVLRGGINVRDLLGQMASVGADSVWIVLIITGATGAVFALYIATLAGQFGGFNQLVGGTVGYGFLNELGPVLAGVGLASRAGAAIAAEIGSMVVTEQVDALRSMAVSPVRYLVAPRILASLIMLPILTAIADVGGLIGGYLLAKSRGVSGEAFWNSVSTYTDAKDLTHGLTKSVVFGFLIGLVACHQGLKTRGGATGVGRATTNSVVLCVVLIFIVDFFLTQILT